MTRRIVVNTNTNPRIEAVVEAVAEALFKWDITPHHPKPIPTWENTTERFREMWRDAARTALNAAAKKVSDSDEGDFGTENILAAFVTLPEMLRAKDQFTDQLNEAWAVVDNLTGGL